MVTTPRFSGKTREADFSEKDWNRLLPTERPSEPVAAIDLGGNAVKMFVLLPNGEVHYQRETVMNGKSVGQYGKIDKKAKSILKQALKHLVDVLKGLHVDPEQVVAVATAGIRSATNHKEMMGEIHSWTQLPFREISAEEESALIYPSVLTGEGILPDEKVLVIEIGGSSTELAFGVGPKVYSHGLSEVLEMGTGRLNLEQPYSSKQVEKLRLSVRRIIETTLTSETIHKVRGRRIFIKSSNLEDWRDIHWAFEQEKRKKKQSKK